MKKYIDYTVEDFAKDDYFIKWILDADPAVDTFWKSWLKENPQKSEVIKKAKQLILSVNFKKDYPENEDYHRIWEAIDREVEQFEEKKTDIKIISIHDNHDKKSAIHESKNPFRKSRAIAASLAGVVLVSSILWFFLRETQVRYVTDYGEIKTIVLPDNSTVKLNANSSLSFINDWEAGNPREVWLNGEGFFSVMHKANNQKFLVHIEDLQIEVLGTEFNVSNRREKATVVLNSGKVKLAYQGKKDNKKQPQTIFMEPGEMVEMFKSANQDNKFLKKMVDPELVTSWRNNQLIFKDTPIKEIIHAIQDQFGIDIIIRDESLTELKYTGTIPLDNIDILFTTLSKSFNIEIIKNKQQIIMQNRRPPDK